MATEILVKNSSGSLLQISFADHATDFVGGTAKNKIEAATVDDVQIDLTGVVTTAGRESAKYDLGAVRAARYSVMATLEFATAPGTGELVSMYWAPSPNSTAANGNPMDIDGVDGAAPSGFSTLAELTAVCQYVGSFVCSADASTQVQTGIVGTFSPMERYGILIVVNDTAVTMGADAIEMIITMTPIIDEAQ